MPRKTTNAHLTQQSHVEKLSFRYLYMLVNRLVWDFPNWGWVQQLMIENN